MLNESNKQLQGNNMTMVKCTDVITSFITKLEIYKSNVSRGELRQFPNLMQNQISTEELQRYSGHLENLKRDFVERFADVINLEISNGLSFRIRAICNRYLLHFRNH